MKVDVYSILTELHFLGILPEGFTTDGLYFAMP